MMKESATTLIASAGLACALLAAALLLDPGSRRASFPAHASPAPHQSSPSLRLRPAPVEFAPDAITAMASLEEPDRLIPPATALRLRAGQDRERATTCLALAIYYEARGEVREGQQAVAQVVLNRVRDPIYPKTVCAVVFQGAERPTGCQFSFTCDSSMDRPPRGQAWKLAQRLARQALDGFVLVELGGAVNYHNETVRPVWSAFLNRASEIGHHIFYTADLTLRSHYEGGEPLFAKAEAAELNADSPLAGAMAATSTLDAKPDEDGSAPTTLLLATTPLQNPAAAVETVQLSRPELPTPSVEATDEIQAAGALTLRRDWFPAPKLASELRQGGGAN